MSIGQRIKAMRVQQGISIDDLAYRLGKNRTTIYRYENGDIENLPLGILDSLAEALNTTPAYLMGWENSTGEQNVVYEGSTSIWPYEFEGNVLNADECEKVIQYARFLLSIRED